MRKGDIAVVLAIVCIIGIIFALIKVDMGQPFSTRTGMAELTTLFGILKLLFRQVGIWISNLFN